MLRPSRYTPALAVAGCGLLIAACSIPAASAVSARTSTARTSTITAGSTPTFTGVAFPTPASGWLLGQPGSGPARTQIWHSATAGQTWQLQWQGPGAPLSLSATDPAHAWVLVACPEAKPSCDRELIATTDAGLRWRVIARLPAAVNEIQFFSGRLGVAISDGCLADRSLPRCPGKVLVSHDGGTAWTPVLAAQGPVFATATAAGQLWAAAPAGSRISFLTSTDGGRSWRPLGQQTSLGPLTPDVQISLDPEAPEAPGTAGASGAPGLAWASVFDPLSAQSAPLLDFSDANHGWLVFGGITWRTSDGGLAWTRG